VNEKWQGCAWGSATGDNVKLLCLLLGVEVHIFVILSAPTGERTGAVKGGPGVLFGKDKRFSQGRRGHE